jgi:two-component system, chemotaxis family, CheB/CheR fusion protein
VEIEIPVIIEIKVVIEIKVAIEIKIAIENEEDCRKFRQYARGKSSMPKLTATSTILEHGISELRLLIERQVGVALDCPNSALAARVADFMEAREIPTSTALLEELRASEQDPTLLPALLDGVLNTGFFRHASALNALTRQVLPQIWSKKSTDTGSPIRMWSAGCGSGEETYSIAMAVCDAVNPVNVSAPAITNNGKGSRTGGIADNSPATQPKLGAGCSIHIVGSDLLQSNIEIADRGIYPQSALDGLPPATIRNYFSKVSSPSNAMMRVPLDSDDDRANDNGASSSQASTSSASTAAHLLVKPRLRSLVTFNCMNLARPGYIGRFDCIFCMDVLPHFSRAQRLAVLERLHLYLEPGGYLFLSQTEKLVAPNLNFRSETFDGYTFHRKPLAASAAYGR